MNSLSDGIRNAIAYIEANLTEPVRIEDIAAKAYVSPYYFQRMFHALCGIPVGEYIRCRRLSAAAQGITALRHILRCRMRIRLRITVRSGFR